jgi:hypothetical protein
MRMRLTVAAARRSQGQAEIWSAGSKHQFTALKAAPGVRLLDGVGPAKEPRRQRTAAPPHPPPRTRPARPETRTRPPSPADGETPAGADPQPCTGIFMPSRRPEGTSDFWGRIIECTRRDHGHLGADGWYYPHGYDSRPWMGLRGLHLPPERRGPGRRPWLAVVQPGPEGLAVKSRGAELAVRRFDHDRRTGSEGGSAPVH